MTWISLVDLRSRNDNGLTKLLTLPMDSNEKLGVARVNNYDLQLTDMHTIWLSHADKQHIYAHYTQPKDMNIICTNQIVDPKFRYVPVPGDSFHYSQQKI